MEKNKTTRKKTTKNARTKEAPSIDIVLESSKIITLIISNTTKKKKEISLFGSCYNSHDFSEFKGVTIRVPESSYMHVQKSIITKPIEVSGIKYIYYKYDNWLARKLRRTHFINRLYELFYQKHLKQAGNSWSVSSKTMNGTINKYPVDPISYMHAKQVKSNQIDMLYSKTYKFDGEGSLEFVINPKVEVLLIISYKYLEHENS